MDSIEEKKINFNQLSRILNCQNPPLSGRLEKENPSEEGVKIYFMFGMISSE